MMNHPIRTLDDRSRVADLNSLDPHLAALQLPVSFRAWRFRQSIDLERSSAVRKVRVIARIGQAHVVIEGLDGRRFQPRRRRGVVRSGRQPQRVPEQRGNQQDPAGSAVVSEMPHVSRKSFIQQCLASCKLFIAQLLYGAAREGWALRCKAIAYCFMNLGGARKNAGRAARHGLRGKNLAGWVARTRPLAEPLSPRGPQPVLHTLGNLGAWLNGPPDT